MDRVVLTLVADSLLVRKQKGCLGGAIAWLEAMCNNGVGVVLRFACWEAKAWERRVKGIVGQGDRQR